MNNIEKVEKSKCCGCASCIQCCNEHTITMQENNTGFLFPVVDESKCVNCGMCIKFCPVLNVKINKKALSECFACINRDNDIRMKSSSGGVFSVFADLVIEKGGVVFGAKFDKDWNVAHSWTEKKESLQDFRGSKYVESAIGNSFLKVKEFLDDDRMVLWTGVPCQTAGLKTFLKKDYENLLTIDVICHGVPGSGIWRKYLEYVQKRNSASRIVKTSFRRRDYGWKMFSLAFTYSDASEYINLPEKDMWMVSFRSGATMRESCYTCPFKDKGIVSDMTLGDFWGIEKYANELDDDKGVSLVFINSEKGNKVFNEVKNRFIMKEIIGYDATKYNMQLVIPQTRYKNRDKFLNCLFETDFPTSYKKYVLPILPVRIYKYIRHSLALSLPKPIVKIVRRILGVKEI